MELAPRVLVIEEDDLLRWSLTQYLAEDGDRINGIGELHGIATLLSEQPDIIIFDLDLPRSTTRGWLRLIREGAPRAVLIATTSEARGELEKDALAEGAAAVLHKPFDLAAVRVLVRQCRENGQAVQAPPSSSDPGIFRTPAE